MEKQKPKQSKIQKKLEDSGPKLVKKAKEIVHEGSVRRVIIKNKTGNTIINIPLIVAGISTLIAPWITVLGVIAALATNCTILIKRREEK